MSRRDRSRADARAPGASPDRGTSPRSVSAPPDAARAEAAARIAWLTLVALTLARAALAFVPSMWAWGLNLMRFVPPIPAWALWALAALALVPAVARRAQAVLEAMSLEIERTPALPYLAWAAAAAALVWLHPDRLRFVGDYLLRFGTAERALKPAVLFPQALPLDVLLHYQLARWLDVAAHTDVNTSARLLGALEAAVLGALAYAFARALDLRGAMAATVAAVVLFGGWLAVLTGYAKAIAEVSVLTAAFAVLGLRVIRGKGGLLAPGICVAVGLVLHRAMLGLLPALALCWIHALRGPEGRARLSRPVTWIAAAIPLVALAAMMPRMIATFATMDPVHFASPEVRRQGGLIGSMFAGTRAADLLDVIVLLSPVALAAPFAAAALGRRAPWGEGLLLVALAAPWMAMMLLLHPSQGLFRDWDDFTTAALTLAMLTAWLVATIARAAPRWSWLGVPMLLGALAPTAQWLMHNADLDRGLVRVETYLHEAPPRSEDERAKTWDFLGIRYAQLARWDRSAEAMAQAASLAPSPRILEQWASAESWRGNDAGACDVYRRLLAITPDEPRAWFGLASAAWKLEDWKEVARAAKELMRLTPDDPQPRELYVQAMRRDSARVAQTR